VQVHCDEGVAIHIGPKPCAVVREGGGEASAGERIGQPLSLENYVQPGRRRVTHRGRQHGRARQRERLDGPAWSKTLACAEALCTGTGRSHVWPPHPGGPHREGEEP
jgi:hypothetical protein